MPPESHFHSTPIRDLGLAIEGTRLEPILDEFRAEIERAGIRGVRPRFYLSDEWGVPADSIAIGIPFYLARPELTALHAEKAGYVEGASSFDTLRYLRHEMGHVVNYAYRLYESEDWVRLFGSMTQPYLDEYRPEPFSRRFVNHLPGWYAQKHPDEDWAETFAVWMTPKLNWRDQYAESPEALAKLDYCDRTIRELAERKPGEVVEELHLDVSQIASSIDQFYDDFAASDEQFPRGLDGALRAIFDDVWEPAAAASADERRPASELFAKLEREIAANVYRWTGHPPERTQSLLRHLKRRAAELQQVYPSDQELSAGIAMTALVTALAMNHAHLGRYVGE